MEKDEVSAPSSSNTLAQSGAKNESCIRAPKGVYTYEADLKGRLVGVRFEPTSRLKRTEHLR